MVLCSMRWPTTFATEATIRSDYCDRFSLRMPMPCRACRTTRTRPTRKTTRVITESGFALRRSSTPYRRFAALPDQFAAMPAGSRAVELWTYRVPSFTLDAFGRPDPNLDPPCERTGETTMSQALHLMNDPQLNTKMTRRSGAARSSGRRQSAAGGDRRDAVPGCLFAAAHPRRIDGRAAEFCRRPEAPRARRGRSVVGAVQHG